MLLDKRFYRIKDLDTGKYYKRKESYYIEDNVPVTGYTYKYVEKGCYQTFESFLFLDDIGNFYNTKKGAEKIISELTSSTIKNRKTPAGRLLNSRFNFVVVKSEVFIEDINKSDEKPQNTP